MATHSGILAWTWTEETGGLQSTEFLQRIGTTEHAHMLGNMYSRKEGIPQSSNNELNEIKQVSLLYDLSNAGMCCKFLKRGWSVIHFPNLFDKTIFSSERIG